MKSKYGARLAGWILVCAAFATADLRAQEEKPAEAEKPAEETKKEKRLPEVVVTATRTATDAEKTATSLTVIDHEEIEARQYRTVEQALRAVPGLHIVSPGPQAQVAGVFMRGTKTESTSILVNGRRLPYNLAGSFNLEMLATDNIERIEVARGPLSSAQGGPAIGGVINIITRDGRGLEKPEAEASFEAGSYETFREAVSTRGAEGPFDWAVGVSRMDTNYQRPNSEFRLSNINTKLGLQVTRDVYADVAVIYDLSDAGSPNNIFDPYATANVLRELWYVSPGVTWQTMENWKQSLYYSHTHYRQVAEEFPQLFGFDFGQNNRVQVNTDQVDYQSEVQVFAPWKLTPGVSFSSTRYSRVINVPNEFAFPVTPAGTEDIQNSVTNAAVFLQSQVDITRDWAFVQSFRFDHYSDFGNPVTWRVGSSYRTPLTRTLLHAHYGTGFAPPTPQDQAGVFGGSPNLSPETSQGYEIGVEQPLWDERVTLSATWFHNDIEDIIIFPAPFFLAANGGEAMTEGVEVGITSRPVDEVEIRFNYTYLTAVNETTGVRLVRRPRHVFNAGVQWRPIPQLQLGAEAQYVADQEDTNPMTFVQEEGDDYAVVRISGSWEVHPRVQIFARVENLANAQYEETIGFPALDQAVYGGVKVRY
jgi:vitamin B12 transporter